MPTIEDIAKKANVSPSTVSRLLTNKSNVSMEKRERILQAIRELGYVYKKDITSRNKTACVGIIVPQNRLADNVTASDPVVYAIASEIRDVLDRKGVPYTLLSYEKALLVNKEHMLPNEFKAFILLGTLIQQEEILLPLIQKNNLIGIIINRKYNSDYFSQIYMDYDEAAYMATEYLIKLGHKKISFVSGDMSNMVTGDRLNGYKRALKDYGIPFNKDIVFNGDFNEKSGYEIGCKIIKLDDRPSAAFIASDLMAIGAQRAFWENGLKLPDDMHVVGCNNISISAYLQPPLTTIHLPAVEIGREAANAAVKLIHEPTLQCIQMRFRPTLVIRESCGEKSTAART